MIAIYRPIFKQALSITWKFKYLWFFGLFAALFGNGGVYNWVVNNLRTVEDQGVFLQALRDSGATFNLGRWAENLGSIISRFDFWGTILFAVFLLIMVFFIWLSVVSQGSLVHGIRNAMKGDEKSFATALHAGISKFWPVFLVNISIKFLVFIAALLVSLPFLVYFLNGGTNAGIYSLYIILTFVVLVPIAAVFGFILKYAVIYVMSEEVHVGLALKKAWKLFTANWIVSIEMALLLFLINILAGLSLVVVFILFSLPFVMLGMIAGYLASNTFFWLVVGLGVLAFIAILFLYGALLNVWQMSGWVILFEKISHNQVYSKVLRWGAALSGGKKKEVVE